jgi:GT2 family glycosyltransferase
MTEKQIDMEKVLLVIPAHNRVEELNELLASLDLLDIDGLEIKVAVVDDGSIVPLKQEVKPPRRFEVFFFHNDVPQGPSHCRNFAAKTIQSDYLWFMDSDTEILSPHVLQHMLGVLRNNPLIGGVGGEFGDIDGKRQIITSFHLANGSLISKNHLFDEYSPEDVNLIASCNLLVRSGIFHKVGGFREGLPRYEDSDLCLRLHKWGYRFYQDKDTVIWHKVSRKGRQSGVFAHQYTDPEAFINDWLACRILILAHNAPWVLPVLPLVDIALFPVVLIRIRAGVYAMNRVDLVFPKYSIKLVISLLLRAVRSYLWGINVFGRVLLRLPYYYRGKRVG